MGHHDDRDLAGVEAALAQLRGHVFARLQRRLAEAGAEPAEVLAPAGGDRGVKAGVDEDRPGAGVADQEGRGWGSSTGGLPVSRPRSTFSVLEVPAGALHHRARPGDVAGDDRFDATVAPGVPPASGSCSGFASTWTFIAAATLRACGRSIGLRGRWLRAPIRSIFRPGLLDGLVCVVSGAGSGLGRATALELARLGATVLGCGRREEPLAETAALAAHLPGGFEREAMDIRDEEAVERLFDGVLERHGRLDVLVNNAGGQFMGPAEAITPKGFRTVIELNVQGTWLMTHAAATKAFIPQRRRQGAERHPLAPQRDAGDGPLGRGPRRGGEHDADAGDRVVALQGSRPARWRRASSAPRPCCTKYPQVGRRQRRALDPAGPRRARPRRWPGWSPTSPRRRATSSPARRSRSTAPATTGPAPGRRRRSPASGGEPRRRGAAAEGLR